MQEMNNIDIIILFVVGISGLIALSRGLVKEVLSIIGWILATIAIIYLLPILNPLTDKYIASGFIGGVVTALCILIVFMIIWNLSTGGLIKDIRLSKMSAVDRILGLFFGIARAFLLVILVYIMISWIMPKDKQPQMLQDSKYFNIAGNFAKPIESLIPQETLDTIRKKAEEINNDKKEDGNKENADKKASKDDAQTLFDKLTQPKVKKFKEDVDKVKKLNEQVDDGYNKIERDNLDRLIDNIH